MEQSELPIHVLEFPLFVPSRAQQHGSRRRLCLFNAETLRRTDPVRRRSREPLFTLRTLRPRQSDRYVDSTSTQSQHS